MSNLAPIQCIYASTSGNVETVVETVAQVLEQAGLAVSLHRAEQTPKEIVINNQYFFLATSTWEHGALNPFFQRLLTEMAEINSTGKVAAMIGLGDRRYEPVLFCEGIERVKRVWVAQGGQELGPTLKIQGEPHNQLDMLVKPWAETRLQDFQNVLRNSRQLLDAHNYNASPYA